MRNLAEPRKKTIATGASRIVERIRVAGRNEQPVVEGFDQEEIAPKRMGQLMVGNLEEILQRFHIKMAV